MKKKPSLKKLLEESTLFDSHCHLNDSKYDQDRAGVVAQALENEVEYIFDMGTDGEGSQKAVENAKRYSNVIASVGIDMETCIPGSDIYVDSWEEASCQFEKISSMLKTKDSEVIGMIGETGIDNYWLPKKVDEGILSKEQALDSLELQKKIFKKHIKLAQKYDLPLSIHSRDAISECLEILDIEGYNFGTFHSLTPETGMNEEEFYNSVNQILEAGFIIGVNGIATFKSAHVLRNTYLKVMEEKTGKTSDWELQDWYNTGFIFETDGPFLAPEGHRGERNQPAYVRDIVKSLRGTRQSTSPVN